MKKILLFMFIIFLTACNEQKSIEKITTNNDVKENNTKKEITEEKKYVDDNPIKIGLYMNNSNKKVLYNEYSPTWELHKDLCSLEIYYTDEKEISTDNQKILWKKYYDKYQNIDKYKLGINIEFDTSDGHINDLILSPKDT